MSMNILTAAGGIAAITAGTALGGPTGGMLAASLVAGGASGIMAYNQAEAQKAAQEAYNKNLEEEAIRQYGELDAVEHDIIQESFDQSLQAQKDYLVARSAVELNAAATGTYGNSVNLAIQDLNTGMGARMGEITYNREAQLDAIDRKAEAIQKGVAVNADRTIQQPSYYSAFSSALGTYNTVSQIGGRVSKATELGSPATN